MSSGYGTFFNKGMSIGAHRFSYMAHKGRVPDGLYVCHSCDYKLCVNPEHLWLGTHSENMLDMIKKGRKNTPVGEFASKSKLTTEQAVEIYSQKDSKISTLHIARKYNVNPTSIRNIWIKSSWAHIHKL